jgi:hypothetical protein
MKPAGKDLTVSHKRPWQKGAFSVQPAPRMCAAAGTNGSPTCPHQKIISHRSPFNEPPGVKNLLFPLEKTDKAEALRMHGKGSP